MAVVDAEWAQQRTAVTEPWRSIGHVTSGSGAVDHDEAPSGQSRSRALDASSACADGPAKEDDEPIDGGGVVCDGLGGAEPAGARHRGELGSGEGQCLFGQILGQFGGLAGGHQRNPRSPHEWRVLARYRAPRRRLRPVLSS